MTCEGKVFSEAEPPRCRRYEESTETAYTWRIHFGDTLSSADHLTLSDETTNYQDSVIDAVDGTVTTVMALNVKLTALAADIERVARDYTTAMSNDPALQATCEAIHRKIRVQPL